MAGHSGMLLVREASHDPCSDVLPARGAAAEWEEGGTVAIGPPTMTQRPP